MSICWILVKAEIFIAFCPIFRKKLLWGWTGLKGFHVSSIENFCRVFPVNNQGKKKTEAVEIVEFAWLGVDWGVMLSRNVNLWWLFLSTLCVFFGWKIWMWSLMIFRNVNFGVVDWLLCLVFCFFLGFSWYKIWFLSLMISRDVNLWRLVQIVLSVFLVVLVLSGKFAEVSVDLS